MPLRPAQLTLYGPTMYSVPADRTRRTVQTYRVSTVLFYLFVLGLLLAFKTGSVMYLDFN